MPNDKAPSIGVGRLVRGNLRHRFRFGHNAHPAELVEVDAAVVVSVGHGEHLLDLLLAHRLGQT